MSTAHKPKVRITVAAAGRLLFKRVMTIFIVTIFATVAVYAALAATIIRVLPSTEISGMVVVKENTFEGGIIPAGEYIVANTNSGSDGEVGDGLFDRLKQGFLPNTNAAIVEVLAGPYADISWMESGLIEVDNELMDVYVDAPETADGDPKEHLSGEYLIRCIEGACEPGEGKIISQDNLYGLLVEDASSVESIEQDTEEVSAS